MVASRKLTEICIITVFAFITGVALLTYVTFAFPDLNDGFLNRRVTVLRWGHHQSENDAGVERTVIVTPLHLINDSETNITTAEDKGRAKATPGSVMERRKSGHVRSVTTIETVFALRDLVWFVVTVCLVGMTLWSYAMVATTDPGRVPDAFLLSSPGSAELALERGNMDVCVPCDVYKPPRAHHCSRCGRCVLKYDHHCPWIAQCVGFFNYKLYLVFIFYAWLLALLVTVSLSHAVYIFLLDFVHGMSSEGSTLSDWSNQTADLVRKTPGLPIGSAAVSTNSVTWPVAATWFYAFVLQMMLSYLVFKHRRLAKHSATTLDEVIYGPCTEYDNDYDMGEEANLAEVYGDGDLLLQPGDEGLETRKTTLTRWQRIARFTRRMLPIPAYATAIATPRHEDTNPVTEESSLVMSPRVAKVYGTLMKNRAVVHDSRSAFEAEEESHHRHRHHHRTHKHISDGAAATEDTGEHHHRHHHANSGGERHPAMRDLRRGTMFRKNSVRH
jgi:hypothetical protein